MHYFSNLLWYNIIRYTVLDSWWWTINLSKTCRFLYENKFKKQGILLVFIIRIYHVARSSECQTLLEELILPQLVKKFLILWDLKVYYHVYKNCHLSLPRDRWNLPTPFYPFIWLALWSDLLPSGFPTEISCQFIFSSMSCYPCPIWPLVLSLNVTCILLILL